MLFRVRSISDKPELLTLDWPSGKPREVVVSTADESPVQAFKNTIEIQPHGMTNLRIVF
jgi:hypothetical protein